MKEHCQFSTETGIPCVVEHIRRNRRWSLPSDSCRNSWCNTPDSLYWILSSTSCRVCCINCYSGSNRCCNHRRNPLRGLNTAIDAMSCGDYYTVHWKSENSLCRLKPRRGLLSEDSRQSIGAVTTVFCEVFCSGTSANDRKADYATLLPVHASHRRSSLTKDTCTRHK